MKKELLWMLLPALCGAWPLQAQLHEASGVVKSDVSWSDCGPGVTVDFSQAIVGPLTYEFQPIVQTEGLLLSFATWMLVQSDGWAGNFTSPDLVHPFQAAGEQIVCLALQGHTTDWADCAAITCKVVDVLQDSSCADLVADFTIAGVDGNTITFQDLSSFPAGIEMVQWSFQGEVSSLATPQHTFMGNGPHKVCLTVTGPSPVECRRTICKWLYLGPAPVPCDQLFVPGFIHVTYDRFVAVMDTSSTSGMERTVWWDFGDGAPLDSGRIAVHEYEWPGEYELCSTVEFEGPLTAGVCAPTHCEWVVAGPSTVGVPALAGGDGPQAHPVPFTDRVVLSGLGPGLVEWNMYDMAGGVVAQGMWSGGADQVLEPDALSPGVYVLRGVQAGRAWSIRLLKE